MAQGWGPIMSEPHPIYWLSFHLRGIQLSSSKVGFAKISFGYPDFRRGEDYGQKPYYSWL